MNDTDQQLPQWQSHKRVHAAKITAIEYHENAEDTCFYLHFGDEPGLTPIAVTQGWLNRYGAKVGWYYVVYLDGYASASPAAAFDEGYTRL